MIEFAQPTDMNDEQLAADCARCHDMLIECIDGGEVDEDGSVHADYEFYGRQLIRSVFAYFEAVTFSLKAASAVRCMKLGIDISPQERYFATDTESELNEKGEIVETSAKISLARNIRFALTLNRRASGVAEPFDPSVEWWSCLREAIRIRDRLTHPKMPGDLDVSGDDIVKVLKARDGFQAEVLKMVTSRSVSRRKKWPTKALNGRLRTAARAPKPGR
jgi:hypothetical protein